MKSASSNPEPKSARGVQNKPANPVADLGAKAQLGQSAKVTRLQSLIALESDTRAAATEKELSYIIANESRNVISARQIFVLRRSGRSKYRIVSISSLGSVERNALLVRAIENMVGQLGKKGRLDDASAFNLSDVADGESADWKNYPFHELLWQPLGSAVAPRFAGMLMVREKPWQDKELTISKHLAEIYAHAWRGLKGNGDRWLKPRTVPKRLLAAGTAVAIVACGFIPVPLTTLAPAEITARDATVIAAPMNGIVDTVLVEPNATVTRGQALVQYIDTNLRNEVKVAESKVKIAEARERQFNQGAFFDERSKHELNVATNELELARAELSYSRDLLSKTTIVAPAAGVALFKDTDEWQGRPVETGLRILRIADPANVELEIQLPVADAIVVEPGSRIRFFLDTSPLDPVEATLVRSSYEASPTPAGPLAYTLTGRIKTDSQERPRVGLRGVAQIFGKEVPLYFFLFRKPIAALRQFIGF